MKETECLHINAVRIEVMQFLCSMYHAYGSCQYKSVLLGLGSDVGIIIEGSIILIFVNRNC